MRRYKIVYNLGVCHHPVTIPFTARAMNETYIEYTYTISMCFEPTRLAFEQSTSSNFIGRPASGTDTASVSFIDESHGDTVVLGSGLNAFSQIVMTPEIVYQSIGLGSFGFVVANTRQIAHNDLSYAIAMASANEITNEMVDSISESSLPSLVELFESFRSMFTSASFEFTLILCDTFVPVPPIRQKRRSAIRNRSLHTIDSCGYRIPNAQIHVGMVLPNWLINSLCLHRYVGIPFMPGLVVVDFQQPVCSSPPEIATYPTFDSLWQSDSPAFDLITIISNENARDDLFGIPILPISRRTDPLDTGWKFAFVLHPEKFEETPPRSVVLANDLLCGGGADIGNECLVLRRIFPVQFSFEEGLPTFVVQYIPECRTTVSEFDGLLFVLEPDRECVSAPHTNMDMDDTTYVLNDSTGEWAFIPMIENQGLSAQEICNLHRWDRKRKPSGGRCQDHLRILLCWLQ